MKKESLTFENLVLYVGIDVHKKQWSVSIFTGQIHHRTLASHQIQKLHESIWNPNFLELRFIAPAVVIARKLLSRIYHVLKYQEPYELGRAA